MRESAWLPDLGVVMGRAPILRSRLDTMLATPARPAGPACKTSSMRRVTPRISPLDTCLEGQGQVHKTVSKRTGHIFYAWRVKVK